MRKMILLSVDVKNVVCLSLSITWINIDLKIILILRDAIQRTYSMLMKLNVPGQGNKELIYRFRSRVFRRNISILCRRVWRRIYSRHLATLLNSTSYPILRLVVPVFPPSYTQWCFGTRFVYCINPSNWLHWRHERNTCPILPCSL